MDPGPQQPQPRSVAQPQAQDRLPQTQPERKRGPLPTFPAPAPSPEVEGPFRIQRGSPVPTFDKQRDEEGTVFCTSPALLKSVLSLVFPPALQSSCPPLSPRGKGFQENRWGEKQQVGAQRALCMGIFPSE